MIVSTIMFYGNFSYTYYIPSMFSKTQEKDSFMETESQTEGS